MGWQDPSDQFGSCALYAAILLVALFFEWVGTGAIISGEFHIRSRSPVVTGVEARFFGAFIALVGVLIAGIAWFFGLRRKR